MHVALCLNETAILMHQVINIKTSLTILDIFASNVDDALDVISTMNK